MHASRRDSFGTSIQNKKFRALKRRSYYWHMCHINKMVPFNIGKLYYAQKRRMHDVKIIILIWLNYYISASSFWHNILQISTSFGMIRLTVVSNEMILNSMLCFKIQNILLCQSLIFNTRKELYCRYKERRSIRAG